MSSRTTDTRRHGRMGEFLIRSRRAFAACALWMSPGTTDTFWHGRMGEFLAPCCRAFTACALWMSPGTTDTFQHGRMGEFLIRSRRAFAACALWVSPGTTDTFWHGRMGEFLAPCCRAFTACALLLGMAWCAWAQEVDFLCPMDPEIRSKGPGRCPRCGMKLEAGLPDPVEYRVAMSTVPERPAAGRTVMLSFRVIDPKTGKPVVKFNEIHEKLFHLFVVSEDLTFYAHEHPERLADGSFRLAVLLPQGGMYRVLADFYPAGGTPQLIAKTVLVAAGPKLTIPEPKGNMGVKLRPEPAQPIAGQKTMLFFDVDPAEGLQPWLGAWGHLLVASADLLDMAHVHPQWEYQPEISPTVQFNVIFPRPGRYRVWVQMQRKGIVNTRWFDVAVRGL